MRDHYGDTIANIFSKVYIYVFYTKNPLAMGLYVVLSIFGYIFGFWFGVLEHIPGPYLSACNKELSMVIMGTGWFLFF